MIYLWQNVMKGHDSLLIKSLSGHIETNVLGANALIPDDKARIVGFSERYAANTAL